MMMLCERFHTVPSVIAQEDADILRLVKIVDMGREDGGDS